MVVVKTKRFLLLCVAFGWQVLVLRCFSVLAENCEDKGVVLRFLGMRSSPRNPRNPANGDRTLAMLSKWAGIFSYTRLGENSGRRCG